MMPTVFRDSSLIGEEIKPKTSGARMATVYRSPTGSLAIKFDDSQKGRKGSRPDRSRGSQGLLIKEKGKEGQNADEELSRLGVCDKDGDGDGGWEEEVSRRRKRRASGASLILRYTRHSLQGYFGHCTLAILVLLAICLLFLCYILHLSLSLSLFSVICCFPSIVY
jgi:hypothetical protein